MHGPGAEENIIDEHRDGIDIYDDDDDLDDDLGHSQHVGGSEDGDLADGEGDDDLLDDDLMDKISSSPSIDDGALYLLIKPMDIEGGPMLLIFYQSSRTKF
ncbi:unnamed protein product [Aspergillus oryzae]|nr:unnamed protein product [Aspergillus oryzae]GMF96621.1 unnamed protein product [Aspergillus oryzae]GMG05708.1 unnamed protein product [Aspergillus oryzae]GMG28124.1 unnamed protein product [Aspergillus oryzae]GMG41485.1 unnamed protein product [Aspergillus oryzae var. brunneus]